MIVSAHLFALCVLRQLQTGQHFISVSLVIVFLKKLGWLQLGRLKVLNRHQAGSLQDIETTRESDWSATDLKLKVNCLI